MESTDGRHREKEAEISKFSARGPQTQATPDIAAIAATIGGRDISEKVSAILDVIGALETRPFDEDVFRKRHGSQIIGDAYITGSTDAVLAFATIARETGLPTKYIETIHRTWLQEGEDIIHGYVYAQVYDPEQDAWRWVDPMQGTIDIPPTQDQIFFAEGLDSWGLGITDHATLSTTFNAFREAWQQQ